MSFWKKLFRTEESSKPDIRKAARDGDLERVKALVKENPDLVFSGTHHEHAAGSSAYDRTPLHEAVENGHKGIVELLLANKAHVNSKDGEKYSPLHRAAAKGCTDVVKLLLANRADVNAKHDFMDYVNGSASLLFPSYTDSGNTPLHYAAFHGHSDVVKLLLAARADVGAKEESFGYTPLHWAAIRHHKEVMNLLLAKRADVNAESRKRWTPLHYAAYFGYKDVAELLLASKADVNAKNEDGETPLATSGEGWPSNSTRFSMECKEVAELLRQHGGHK